MVPNQPEKILTAMYGDWKTPVKYTQGNRQHENFFDSKKT
jgi:hypothetical protein